MNKVFISFLGTNKYIHTRYKINNFISKPVRYIQEALAEYFCKGWNENDRILIFATDGEHGSIKRNWEKGEINERDKFSTEYEPNPTGLKDRLKNLNLKCKIEMIPIPDGIEEGEIWKIIQKIYENINKNDELYIDITHSFRFIPMIIPSMIIFLKTVKNIKLHSIHYGAFEKLGAINEVINKKLENRIAPVRELTELYKMIEWSEATSAFLKYGDGKRLINQIDKIDTSKIDKKTKNLFTPIKNSIIKTEEALKFNNVTGLEEIKKLGFPNKIKKIDITKYANLFAFSELLPEIEKFVKQWSDDEVLNGFLAAKWCLENDRIAQSLTFLQEAMITYFCNLFNWDKNDNTHRGAVSFMIKIALGENELEKHLANGKKWFDDTKYEALKQLKQLDKNLLENFLIINQWRNTVNHAKEGDRSNIQNKYPRVFEEIFTSMQKELKNL
jgi:CRISPR-associated Csx2 family protein